jgi:2-keto-4-pentenoate hydratase
VHMRRFVRTISCLVVFLWSARFALPAEPAVSAALAGVSEAYFAKRPASGISTGMTYQTALQAQKEYVTLLEKHFGKRAGYKVGLVTTTGQQRYNISHPVRGVLFEKMLLPDGSAVPADYGTRPIVEPDLLVRVKDATINDAKSAEEVMAQLSEIICFIELADGTFATNAPIDAGVLTASNVGARLGVLGERRKVENTKEFFGAFGKMSLVLRDGAGKELSRVTADGVMGHPMNALLWFVQDLQKTGEKLKAGDVVSLGSPSPQVTPKAGEKFVLSYEGLPGGPVQAKVSFR